MQASTSLSVAEAEVISGVSCTQDLLYEKRLIESIGCEVELPMILWTDSQAFVDLFNNWSVGGRTRHVDLRLCFMRELKAEGILLVKWKPTADNSTDMFTKNLDGPAFSQHTEKYCGKYEH